jgi:hypothetical protein
MGFSSNKVRGRAPRAIQKLGYESGYNLLEGGAKMDDYNGDAITALM